MRSVLFCSGFQFGSQKRAAKNRTAPIKKIKKIQWLKRTCCARKNYLGSQHTLVSLVGSATALQFSKTVQRTISPLGNKSRLAH